jgi:cytochrome P450
VWDCLCEALSCSHAAGGTTATRLGKIQESSRLIDPANSSQPCAPGHSFLFGHLLYLKTYLDRIPKDAHFQYAFGMIGRENFLETGAYYIDLWPMTGITLIIISPEVASQVTQTNPRLNCERPKLLPRWFKPITGGLTMFDLDEAAWKPWRVVFNKGFHSDRINSLVPGIVQETMVYANTLRTLAKKGELVLMESITLRFTIDVIGKTIL